MSNQLNLPLEEESWDLSDNLDNIPDVEIEYQEDDGNSNCDEGGCVI